MSVALVVIRGTQVHRSVRGDMILIKGVFVLDHITGLWLWELVSKNRATHFYGTLPSSGRFKRP